MCGDPDPNTVIPINDHHKWGEYIQTTLPTCSAQGIKTQKCAECTTVNSVTQTGDAINPSAHDWGNWTIVQPTETTDGGDENRICAHNTNHYENRSTGEILYATGTIGLEYELLEDNNAYCVRAGTVTDGVLYIPAFHRPNSDSEYLPVTQLGNDQDRFSRQSTFMGKLFTAVHFLTPSNITFFNDNTFTGCYNLEEITLPAGITSIRELAFSYCINLKEITLPEGIGGISLWAFRGCTSLSEITLPETLYAIGSNPFADTSIVFTVAPGNNNFSVIDGGKGLVRQYTNGNILVSYPTASGIITLPAEITDINPFTFIGCANLTKIILPSELARIDQMAFSGCTNLNSVTFMGNITASNLASATFPGDLRDKYLAEGIGTYTRETGSNTWTKQN